MANPFERRATENLRDDEAGFLSLVSPEPLETYLGDEARRGQLYDKLVRIIGTPGSGKTTMATLLETRMVGAALADADQEGYRDIIRALESCGVVERGQQVVAGVRLPMEGEYRDFWELPYDAALKTRLVLALIQARAILAWVRGLQRRPGDRIVFVIRPDADAALEGIGGPETQAILDRARRVERAVYGVGASLVAPREEDIPEDAVRPFRPFDVIEGLELTREGEPSRVLKPLVILDDAHNLAPPQFDLVFRDLARRELRLARWILMRLDGLAPHATLIGAGDPLAPELKLGRDYVDILLQKEDRKKSRAAFRSVARSMADRYLRRHPIFERLQRRTFSSMLSEEPPTLPEQTLKRLTEDTDKAQRRLRLTARSRADLETEIDRFASGAKSQDVGPDVRLAMLRILMHRYVNQAPQQSLFEGDDEVGPRKAVIADSGVAHGARLHLRHQFGRPLHYGLKTLSDASSENAELFLHIAAALVDRMEARIINGDSPVLSAQQQDQILGKRARAIIERWNFPFAAGIRNMLAAIARDCETESLAPNAWLDAGANAIGVPQEDFVRAVAGRTPHVELAQILHYAVAYNAVILRPSYSQGGKTWCLIELGGPAILANALTLNRGGFLEKRIEDLFEYAGVGS